MSAEGKYTETYTLREDYLYSLVNALQDFIVLP